MIYLDSAAVVKLVRQEEHSADLVAWLNTQVKVPLVSSVLVEVEVPSGPCAARHHRPWWECQPRLDGCSGWRSTPRSGQQRQPSPKPTLRSLDAIHLATAQVLANEAGAALTAFVSYDQRLLASARKAEFPTASPGHV